LVDAPSDTAPDAPNLRPPGLLFPDLEWIALEGLPDHCVVDRAADPTEVFDVEWLPCPDAPGCRHMRSPEPAAEIRPRSFAGTYDGEQAYLHFWYRRRVREGEPRPSGQFVQFLVGAESGPVLAIRVWTLDTDKVCSFGAMATHPEAAAFRIFTSSPDRSHVYHAPLRDIGGVSAPWAVVSAFLQSSAVSPTTFVAETGGGPLVIIEGDQVRRVEPTPEIFGIPQIVHVVGHLALWEDWPGLTGTRLVGATLDDGPSVLWGPEGWDVKRSFVRPDGLVAWTQSRGRPPEGGPYDENELWTAQVTGTGLTDVRRRVRDVDGLVPVDGPDLHGHGRLTRSSSVYDLDGEVTRYALDPPSDSVMVGILVASSPEELFFKGTVDGLGTFIRLERAVYLVDGTVPEG